MQILTINFGSSSVKVSVFSDLEEVLTHNFITISDHHQIIRELPKFLAENSYTKFDAIGHRIAHGGKLNSPHMINQEVKRAIKEATPFAPEHNPLALEGINIVEQLWSTTPQVAVFDTSFHKDMPPVAKTYAIPNMFRDNGFQRVGFHGLSHEYILLSTSTALGKHPQELNIISCHLGNGSSICAIKNGVSIDTSMGMTPLEGLIMGTRCGDLDPGIPLLAHQQFDFSPAQFAKILYEESGLKALCGTNDMQQIELMALGGSQEAKFAIELYSYRVKKYIGSYTAALGGCDAIVFTGGIGENSAMVREISCIDLKFLGIELNNKLNSSTKAQHLPQFINTGESKIKVLVTKTHEQWIIANAVMKFLHNEG